MKAEKIIHRGITRIRVDFPFNQAITQQLRKIDDARWSKTLAAWHIPYSKASFKQLLELFPDIEIIKNEQPPRAEQIERPERIIIKRRPTLNENKPVAEIINPVPDQKLSTETEDEAIPLEKRPEIEIRVTTSCIYVKIPKNATDIQYMRSFRYARWDDRRYCWIIPNYRKNLDLLQSYFTGRQVLITEIKPLIIEHDTKPTYSAGQVLAVNTHNRVLKLYCAYNRTLIDVIKSLPLHKWSRTENCWTVPYSDKNVNHLREVAEGNGLEWTYREHSKTQGVARLPKHNKYLRCPESYIAKMKELRYSQNTLNVYVDMFEEFMNYYADKDLNSITEEEIVAFLRYLVNERMISGSYQNQSINAIKFYYERVLGGRQRIYEIERPRKEKSLPEVLSEEEVTAILKSITNLKHKAIIMTIYSAGLRIGELVKLRVKDIDSQRMQIRVEQAKGKKDRYTLLSKRTLETLREYFSEFKPKDWLFEGESGGQYATRSIQNILRCAVDKVGIKKRITVHTLRHSFATHLLESGTDLRYIQNLLGHESSKTTEIYTHITTRGLDQIKNPLDRLDL